MAGGCTEGRKHFFFEKKKQKTFVCLRLAKRQTPCAAPSDESLFASFSSEKEESFLLSLVLTQYATVTWDQLHRDARRLAGLLMDRTYSGIVAVSRGGLVPAAIVARELDIRVVECISVISYAGEAGSAAPPRIVKPAPAAGDGTGFLVIDDLVDRGGTAQAVRAALPLAVFACLYAKPAGRAYADRFVAEVAQEVWILFPWDTAPADVPPLGAKKAALDFDRDGREGTFAPDFRPPAL